MPYLRHIKAISREYPHLRHLAQWMQVTTTPVKWQWIKEDGESKIRKERAARINVATVDFVSGDAQSTHPETRRITTREDLSTILDEAPKAGTTRLYVVEDLSRDMIELLGWKLDIDPLFFREHVNDYWVSNALGRFGCRR
jgi:hypothetical protein